MGPSHHYKQLISGQFLFRTYLACHNLGARKPVLLKALNIREPELRNPLKRFDCQAITALCDATRQELKSANVADLIGQSMVPTGFSDMGYPALFEKTYKDILGAALKAQDFDADIAPLYLEKTESHYRLIWRDKLNIPADIIHVVFSAFSHFLGRIENRRRPIIKAAYFSHGEDDFCDNIIFNAQSGEDIRCFFNCDQTYLELDRNIMGTVNPNRNALIIEANNARTDLLNLRDGNDKNLTKLSYNYLFHLLDKAGLSLDCAAETFAIAERTLRRKLVAEGTSFRQILEQVRRDTCQLYFLEGTHLLSDISAKLGYSELSAFTRAYTAWHGHAPSRDMAQCAAMAA